MKAANYDVKLLKDEFGAGTPDPDWLPVVAAKGWIIIGKDDRWRYRAEEKQILINAKARTFIFVSKSAKREEIAEAVVAALPKMAQLIASQPPPFIARVLLSGYVGIIYPPEV